MNIDRAIRDIVGWLGMDDDPDTVRTIRRAFDAVAGLQDDSLPEGVEHFRAVPYKSNGDAALTLEIFKPEAAAPLPVLVYCHGGAWIAGSPATHFQLTGRIASQGYLVLSVDYRLAPEHPFPAAYEDCQDAVRFAAANAHTWGGDNQQLIVAGDSAGANLSAAVAAHWTDTECPIRAVGLLYGVFDFTRFDPDGITGLLVDAYLGDQSQLVNDPRVSPLLRAEHLPPAHIAIGDDDDLLEDSEALRAALARAGNVHDYQVYPDMPHAFAQMDFLAEAEESIRRMTGFFDEILAER